MPMAKVRIDTVEYEIPEGVAKVVSDKVQELEALKKAHQKLQGRADALESEVSQKNQEMEKLKNTKPSQKEMIAMAKSRLDLEDRAAKVLGAAFKADGLEDLEIKKALIQKLKPELKLDDKSEDYIAGCFETLKEEGRSDQGHSLKQALAQVHSDSGLSDPQKARKAAMERSQVAAA